MKMHHRNLESDVKEALALLRDIIGDGVTLVRSVCCYDGHQEVSKGEMDIPGGGHLLWLEGFLENFILSQKARGVEFGYLYIHLKCLFLFSRGYTTEDSQNEMAEDFQHEVERLNSIHDVNWNVVVEAEGSAPI